jgi:hypothetical protein
MNIHLSTARVIACSGVFALFGFLGACDPNNTSGGGGLEFDLTGLSIPDVEPPVIAATPQSLGGIAGAAISSTGSLIVATITIPENDDFCMHPNNPYDTLCPVENFPPSNSESGAEVAEARNLCLFIADVKCRLFAPSPTEIADLASQIDNRVASYEQRAEGGYVPCLDPDSESFASIDFNTNFTNLAADRAGAEQEINLGVNYSLSCSEGYSTSEGGPSDNFIGLGQATINGELTTYIREGNINGGGSLAIVDDNANVDFFKTFPENKDATWDELEFSAGLVHLNVDGSTGKMQLTFTGRGLGPGCGVQVMTDGSLLYAKANINPDSRCSEAEQADAIGQAAEGPEFDASKVGVEYCLRVDVPTSMTSVDLAQCSAAGLSTSDFTIAPLTRDDLEPYNAAKLFSDAISGVPAFTVEALDSGEGGDGQDGGEDGGSQGTGTDAFSFTCHSHHADGTVRSCSAGTITASGAEAICGEPESETGPGQGCCESATVYTNAYGGVTQFEVVPEGSLPNTGAGQIFDCPE